MMRATILCGLAMTAAAMTAQNDRINFFRDGAKTHSLRADAIESMTWHGGDEYTGYSTLLVGMTGGTERWFDIDDISSMTYAQGLPDNPLQIGCEPHHYNIVFDVKAPAGVYYRLNAMTEEELAGIDESLWAETVVQADIDYIMEVVERYGKPLEQYRPEDVFEWGDQPQRELWPEKAYTDNMPIVAVAWTGRIDGGRIEVTTEPLEMRFSTKELVDTGVRFDLTAEMTATTLKVIAEPVPNPEVDNDVLYNIEVFSPEQIEAYGLGSLIGSSLNMMMQAVYGYAGMTWEELLYRGRGERLYTNMRTGDEWVAVAYGVEYGVCITDVCYEVFTIPMADVDDDCTFVTETNQLTAAECEVRVTPSSPDTRYTAILAESWRLEGTSPEMYVADKVYWLNYKGGFSWSGNPLIHRGEAVLNTHDGVIDGKYLQAGTEYSLLIFGVGDEGLRTTAVKEVRLLTTSQGHDDLTFEVAFSNFDSSSSWSHHVDVTVTPSDPEASYTFGYLAASNQYADIDNYTDEEFMLRYADVQGQYLDLFTGEYSKRCSFGSEYDYEADDWVFKPYLIFVYGYDGAPTTDLHAWMFDPATGEAERVR